MASEKRLVRVTVGLTSPGDPLEGAGPRLIPGIYEEQTIRNWLNVGGQLSEANFDFAVQEGWVKPIRRVRKKK